MKCLELFTGAGGLAMGMARAGFSHTGLVEFNHEACETIRFNKSAPDLPMKNWRIVETDVRLITDFSAEFKGVKVVAGGPPCQPFSMGGKARGPSDPRDMFPEAVRAVRQIRPLAFIFENVKGLLREAFTDYFEYVILQLTYPGVVRRGGEATMMHRARLEKLHTEGASPDLRYHVVWQLLNAADYGVPQRRERVFIVGFRSDVRAPWSFPVPTHSKEALDYAKFVSGEYFRRHDIPLPPGHKSTQLRLNLGAAGYKEAVTLRPWNTVRNALLGLRNPEKYPMPDYNHVCIPGARSYPGHTGSAIDEPAKTLKAGDHGVPGGENMLLLPNGNVRYFTVREAARLQTFPDEFKFKVSWTESMRQLGNAVPVELGRIVGSSVRSALR